MGWDTIVGNALSFLRDIPNNNVYNNNNSREATGKAVGYNSKAREMARVVAGTISSISTISDN